MDLRAHANAAVIYCKMQIIFPFPSHACTAWRGRHVSPQFVSVLGVTSPHNPQCRSIIVSHDVANVKYVCDREPKAASS